MLHECLEAIGRALHPGDELIVVDSASTMDDVRKVVARHDATYLRCDEPGASRARNCGWRAARNPVIVFTDDDVRVAADWIDAFCAVLSAHPAASFVIGRVEVPPHAGEVIRPVAVVDEPLPARIAGNYRGSLGASANLAFRRDALEALRGFDERLGPGGDLGVAEDHDLLDRALGAGLWGQYEPSVRAWHEQWRDQSSLVRLDWAYGNGMGARVAKLMRSDRRRARHVARVTFWEWGLRDVLRYARERHRFLVVTSAVRVAGGLRGLVRGLLVPVRDGHFRSRPASGRTHARLRPGR
jgi:glycosyltransferase involved in cell wall biosynthesis